MAESTILVRNPIARISVEEHQISPRPEDLRGLTVGLVNTDPGWLNFAVVLERFETLLKERSGAGKVSSYIKEAEGKFARSNRPMVRPMLDQIVAECDVAILGLGN